MPPGCRLTSVQGIVRHGARAPTPPSGDRLHATLNKIRENVKEPPKDERFAFLTNYKYNLKVAHQTSNGQGEMHKAGKAFCDRYGKPLGIKSDGPTFRAQDKARITDAGNHFRQGYFERCGERKSKMLQPEMKTFPEPDSPKGPKEKGNEYLARFMTPITKRLNEKLPGASLNNDDSRNLMEMCPFTAAQHVSVDKHSQFCDLFTLDEWKKYNHYQTVSKFYRHSNGNGAAVADGVGFAKELHGRLKNPEASPAHVDFTSDK